MAKVAIVYWSGSGNTEAMAQAIENAAKDAGAETTLSFVSDTTASDVQLLIILFLAARRWGMKSWKNMNLNHFLLNCCHSSKVK